MALAALRQTCRRLGCRNLKHLAFRTGLRQSVELDIREVAGIDEAGRCLLRVMNSAGARFSQGSGDGGSDRGNYTEAGSP